ncbi:MAG: reverse transcriptase domain-containing protein [candidate division FCPU426 bacterium]
MLRKKYSLKTLKAAFEHKYWHDKNRGIDYINGEIFKKRLQDEFAVIKRKCVDGKYQFAPYLELLKLKGRDKKPRVVAIPTLRDRIVLNQLKEILAEVFPEANQMSLANTYIDRIARYLNATDLRNTMIYQTDIKEYYPNIDNDILITKLKDRIRSKKLLSLIEGGLKTPIVNRSYHKRERNKLITKGVPQGLAISNILANIYLLQFDREMQNDTRCCYFRYVDDILVITKNEYLDELINKVEEGLRKLKLEIDIAGVGKTRICKSENQFEYLGYLFRMPVITVRPKTVENYLHSIVSMFSRFKNKIKDYSFVIESPNEVFITELNEKITGAISDKKRYGWIFYFLSMNDVGLLYRIDKLIRSFFRRLDEFEGTPPQTLKSLARSFYEAKYSPNNGYIMNYNNILTVSQKLLYLKRFGYLNYNRKYSNQEVENVFNLVKMRRLSKLSKDDANIY